MAIGRRRRAPQRELFVAASDIRALDNPFYRALNGLLEESGFDEFAEERCREFYAGNRGRPGVPPGVYFRMLMVGYLEGLGSERGIAWRCADSFSLREFLGCGLTGNPPEHSTLSKTRKRLSVEAHGAVFGFVLERLMESGLLSGKTLGGVPVAVGRRWGWRSGRRVGWRLGGLAFSNARHATPKELDRPVLVVGGRRHGRVPPHDGTPVVRR